MLEHMNAAELALRQLAPGARGADRVRLLRHAELLAQIQRDFQEGPLGQGGISRRERVDALLDGTDALRLQADAERRAASANGDPAEREARAAELERRADAIVELDRELRQVG